METKNWSASQLIKSSCRQLKYLTDNKKEYEVTERMLQGEEYQNKQIEKTSLKEKSLKEMRSTYSFKNNLIHFCIDELTINKCIEHKMVTGKVEDWYFNISILQVALYKSFIMSGCIDFVTASFMINKGFPLLKRTINKEMSYKLYFGDDNYLIKVSNYKKIISFYESKIDSCKSWDDASDFDFLYKHREYDQLSKYIKFKKT